MVDFPASCLDQKGITITYSKAQIKERSWGVHRLKSVKCWPIKHQYIHREYEPSCDWYSKKTSSFIDFLLKFIILIRSWDLRGPKFWEWTYIWPSGSTDPARMTLHPINQVVGWLKALVAIRWKIQYYSTTVYRPMLTGWIVHQLALGVLSNIRRFRKSGAKLARCIDRCNSGQNVYTMEPLSFPLFQLSFNQF